MTESDWNSCTDPQAMLNFLRDTGKLSERKARLFAAACCRRVWPLMTDERSRSAVAVLERYTEGKATEEELSTAARGAQVVADHQKSTASPYAAAVAANALEADLPREYTRGGDEDEEAPADLISCAKDAAFAAAWAMGDAAHPEDSGDEWFAATKAEEAMHCHLLRCIFGPLPSLPLTPLTRSLLDWHGAAVVKLAQAIYEERALPSGHLDATRLAVLADMLEEAGATDAGLLGHLRGPGPHVRGCHSLDLLLGKV